MNSAVNILLTAFLSFILHCDGFVDHPTLFLKRKVCSRITSAACTLAFVVKN